MDKNPSVILTKWLKVIGNPQFNIAQSMQDRFQALIDEAFNSCEKVNLFSKDEEEVIADMLEKQRYLKVILGDVEFSTELSVNYRQNGLQKVILKWAHTTTDKIIKLEGFFFRGFIMGNIARSTFQGDRLTQTEVFYCKQGTIHGFYRILNHDDNTFEFGLYINGRRNGYWWKSFVGGSFICIQKALSNKRFECVYFYPDLSTTLEGQFESQCQDLAFHPLVLKMIEARVKIVSFLMVTRFGLLDVGLVEAPDSQEVYKFEEENQNTICQYPLLRDPFETRYVIVKKSSFPNAGEGLFAIRKMEKGRVVAYFHGVKQEAGSKSQNEEMGSSDYSIAFHDENQNNFKILDIPKQCQDVSFYCASLAHKICHSFTPNAKYSSAFHPRFGQVRCAVSLQPIEVGDEITCDYKYSITKAPDWYKELLRQHISLVGLET